MNVELRVLGPPLILVNGGPPPPDLEYRKHKALLVYLVCAGDKWRSREFLGELLWPTGFAARSVSQALVQIRKVLDSAVESDGDLVRLTPGSVHTDLTEFLQLAGREEWATASALVRGEFCEGLTIKGAPDFDHWLLTERLRWRESGLKVVVRHAEQLLDAGEVTTALHQFRRAGELDRLSEPALRGVMQCLALTDQRAAALAEYQLLVERLEAAVDSQPSEETRRLAERLRSWTPRRQAPAYTPEIRRPPLVGRQEPLSALRNLWSRVLQARKPAVAIIMAESGLGKSRLAEELVSRARLEGAACSTIRLLPGDQDLPECGIIGLARGGLLHARGVSAAPPAAIAGLAQRIPEWAERYPTGPSGLSAGESLEQVLRTVGEEQPVLLAVDDAHWCDAATIVTLTALLRDLAHTPLLVLLALEPEPVNEKIDQLRARVGREVNGLTLRLQSLSHAEVQELAAWALPAFTQDQLERVARRILADSAGIPLLVTELLNAVALGFDIGRVNGAWPEPKSTLTDTLPGALPDSVVGALRVSFRRLSPAAQQVLRTLAISGQQMTEADLVGVAELPAAEVAAALDELEWQRWLNGDARGYDFVARIARGVIERDMSTAGQRERVRSRLTRPSPAPVKG